MGCKKKTLNCGYVGCIYRMVKGCLLSNSILASQFFLTSTTSDMSIVGGTLDPAVLKALVSKAAPEDSDSSDTDSGPPPRGSAQATAAEVRCQTTEADDVYASEGVMPFGTCYAGQYGRGKLAFLEGYIRLYAYHGLCV